MFGAMTGLTLGTGTAGWTWRGRVMRAVIDGSRTVAGAQQPGFCGGSGGSGGIAGKGPQGLPHGSKWVCDLAEQKLQPSQRPPNDARAAAAGHRGVANANANADDEQRARAGSGSTRAPDAAVSIALLLAAGWWHFAGGPAPETHGACRAMHNHILSRQM